MDSCTVGMYGAEIVLTCNEGGKCRSHGGITAPVYDYLDHGFQVCLESI